MNPLEQVFDRLTGGSLTRIRDERDSARRTVRVLAGRVGADIPVEDHIEAVQLLGAILARFTGEDRGVHDEHDRPVRVAHAGREVVEHWRARHRELGQRLAGDRRLEQHAERQRAGAVDGT